MPPDATNVALARNFALLRLLACPIEDDDPLDGPTNADVVYFLDANIPIFFADPVSDAFLLQIFGGHAAFDLPEVETLAKAEDRLLSAFARHEGDRLPKLLAYRQTHVLRPHLLEIAWRRSRIGQEYIDKSTFADPEDWDRERNYIKAIEREIPKAKDLKKSDAKNFFDIFLTNFLPSMVRQVERLARLNLIVKTELLQNTTIKVWEVQQRANSSLWSFLYEQLMAIRSKHESPQDVHFNVMQDAEALSLVCQYAMDTSNRAAFITFDWNIHRLFDCIYNSDTKIIPSDIKAQLPSYNFVRHPIVYTAFVSEFETTAKKFRLRNFIRDIDLLFHRLIGDACYRRALGDIGYRNKIERIEYLLGPGTDEFHRALRPFAETLSQDILFVHEESAVNAVSAVLESEPYPSDSEDQLDDQIGRADLESVLKIVTKQIEARSGEKATALVKALAAIPIVDTEIDTGEPQLEDEARLILREWSESPPALPRTRSKQLLRDLPGWIRIDQYQFDILNSIVDDTEAFINSLSTLAPKLDERFYLLGALIAAIKDDWALSERYAIIARDFSTTAHDQTRLAESQYWIAVSRRCQRDPGIRMLHTADRQLGKAIRLAKNDIDRLRFESEREALNISIPYHRYFYGERYDDVAERKPASEIAASVDKLIKKFVKTVHVPYDPIGLRLGIQLYSNMCLLNLFSWGLPPKFGADQPRPRPLAKRHFERLQQLCSTKRDITVSIRTQFILHASDFAINANDEAIQRIKKLNLSGDDILIPFTRRMVTDFIALAPNGFGPAQ
jgi:hypothetical protein